MVCDCFSPGNRDLGLARDRPCRPLVCFGSFSPGNRDLGLARAIAPAALKELQVSVPVIGIWVWRGRLLQL